MMLGGTLPVPLYVLYEKQMGFGPLGVTVVFAAYVVGTLFALVALGDLSDHVGRRKVLAIAVACAAVSTGAVPGRHRYRAAHRGARGERRRRRASPPGPPRPRWPSSSRVVTIGPPRSSRPAPT